MKRAQFNMFCKMIAGAHKAKVKEYTFIIKEKQNGIYQLLQQSAGLSIVLKQGRENECVEAAKDCVQMMYEITD